MIRQLGNMKVLSEKEKKVDYIVLKIGTSVFSGEYPEISMIQEVDTKGVGEQDNLWIKGEFIEGKNHKKFKDPIPMEINIYFNKKVRTNNRTLSPQSI